jgi:hypothetical protein
VVLADDQQAPQEWYLMKTHHDTHKLNSPELKTRHQTDGSPSDCAQHLHPSACYQLTMTSTRNTVAIHQKRPATRFAPLLDLPPVPRVRELELCRNGQDFDGSQPRPPP